MLQNQSDVFSFHLDEALWFKDGQGVRELVGISLEPEITIEPLGDNVRLNGSVVLTGEYRIDQEAETESPATAYRYIDEIIDGEEGLTHFNHLFPIEITVPLNRIARLDQIFVDIHSFDYELPASNQLRLHAEVFIHGIEQQAEKAQNDEGFSNPERVGPVDFPQEHVAEPPLLPEREAPIVQLNEEQNEKEADRWPKHKSQSFSEFFHHEKKQEVLEVSSESTSVWEEDVSSYEQMESSVQLKKEESSSSSDENPVGGIKHIFKHLFPNREDSYTQMKMYIVQDDETFESIAAKYEITVGQLERANKNRDDVTAGQIVYIPC